MGPYFNFSEETNRMRRKIKRKYYVFVFIILYVACSRPSEPEFDNPYDDQSDAFIPHPDLVTLEVDSIRAFEAWSGGEFANDYGHPVTAKGVCWSSEENPTIDDDCTNDGDGLGTFESHLNNLEPDQQYFVRAYATSEGGTVYGDQQAMQTRDGRVSLLTGDATDITPFSATVEVHLEDDGGAEVIRWGLCYDRDESPTVEANCLQEHLKASGTSDSAGNGNALPEEDHITNKQQSKMSLSLQLDGLEPNRRYYVRSFAENLAGISYGPEIYFDTEEGLAEVTTRSVDNITHDSARSGGTVADEGGSPVTQRGVCWSTSQYPTTIDCTSDGSGTGSFTSILSNLQPETRYYVRAYATNSAGTSYGSQREFATEDENWQRDIETNIVEVTSPTGRVWMDRNLGASRAATSIDDEGSYGDLYQWGRPADGHQKRNSGTTSTISNSDQPGHGDFILAPNSPFDWRSPQNDNLWQGVNSVNNPCPDGYRLPTEPEWEAERQSWSSNNRVGAFESPLKLPVAGRRGRNSGSLLDVGSSGRYWSGTVDGSGSRRLLFSSSDAGMDSGTRTLGRSVRCLKN